MYPTATEPDALKLEAWIRRYVPHLEPETANRMQVHVAAFLAYMPREDYTRLRMTTYASRIHRIRVALDTMDEAQAFILLELATAGWIHQDIADIRSSQAWRTVNAIRKADDRRNGR